MMNETAGRPIIVLVGHGGLPQGMLDAAEMILGKQGGVHVISLAPGEDPEDLGRRLTGLTAEVLAQDGAHDLLVLGDLFGGSPANAAAAATMRNPLMELVTGLNLPMLLEVLTAGGSAHEAARVATTAGSEGVVDVRARLEGSAEKS